jgi:hypothetical protein
MSQSHFTLSFPLKSPADAKVLAEQLPPLMPQLFQAADTIGTIHYSGFTVLSEKTLLFLGDFDSEFSQLMADLARHAGTVFDAIFEHVDNPPSTPVADHADAFVEWTAAHLVHPLNIYTAYPDVTAKEIKTLASAADDKGPEFKGGEIILSVEEVAARLDWMGLRSEHKYIKTLSCCGVGLGEFDPGANEMNLGLVLNDKFPHTLARNLAKELGKNRTWKKPIWRILAFVWVDIRDLSIVRSRNWCRC